jgi:NAD(P)-dependent dehydrogenase (short-subunit alcohol dehydrogenase family)
MDVCILNAGIGESAPFLAPDTPQRLWQATLDIDLVAVIAGIKAAAACMRGRGGTIISIASAGALNPMPASPVYAASKAGVLHLTRSVAGDLAQQGILAHVSCPHFTGKSTSMHCSFIRHPYPCVHL